MQSESVDQDLIAAEYWFRKSAEQGNLDAQYQLGRMYDSGLGVSINKKEAFKWYSLSAEQGSIDAQYNLGLAYRLGIGVEQSFTKSLKWYKESALKVIVALNIILIYYLKKV